MSALVSRILLIQIQIITVFWAKNYFGLISAWVAESEQMSGPKGDEFDMSFGLNPSMEVDGRVFSTQKWRSCDRCLAEKNTASR